MTTEHFFHRYKIFYKSNRLTMTLKQFHCRSKGKIKSYILSLYCSIRSWETEWNQPSFQHMESHLKGTHHQSPQQKPRCSQCSKAIQGIFFLKQVTDLGSREGRAPHKLQNHLPTLHWAAQDMTKTAVSCPWWHLRSGAVLSAVTEAGLLPDCKPFVFFILTQHYFFVGSSYGDWKTK